MTTNSLAILNYMKSTFGEEHTKQEIADAVGVSLPAVTGSVNALIKKNLVETREQTVTIPANGLTKEVVKVVKYHKLNEDGLAYDPEKEEAEKAAAKAAAAAEKKAAKAKA